jgi:hypothetical protein
MFEQYYVKGIRYVFQMPRLSVNKMFQIFGLSWILSWVTFLDHRALKIFKLSFKWLKI